VPTDCDRPTPLNHSKKKGSYTIMAEDINKAYVQRYVEQAQSTDNEDLKLDALYRAGTQMEVINCDGNSNLTPEQQQTVLDAAKELLGDSNG
jgi:hypothetical protein